MNGRATVTVIHDPFDRSFDVTCARCGHYIYGHGYRPGSGWYIRWSAARDARRQGRRHSRRCQGAAL